MNERNMVNDNTTILLIGGYGNTGRILARLLFQYTTVQLVLGGRNVMRAVELAQELGDEERVTSRYVDASDVSSLQEAFRGVSLVIVASSTAQHVQMVARTAIKAGIDYMDVQYSRTKTQKLQEMEAEIEKAGLCFITDCGFHPGLPAALIRYVAPSFDRLEAAHVGSVIQMDWAGLKSVSPETIEEFAGEFVDFQTMVFKNGEWKNEGVMAMVKPRVMDFGPPFFRKKCVPMFLAEMNDVPLMCPGISETGFYVGSLNWVVDWLVSPIVLLAMKVCPNRKGVKRVMGRFLHWGLRTFSKPPFGTCLKVEASGVGVDGKPLERNLMISHLDGYALTASPVAATVLQYLATGKESIRKPGLWLQGSVVDPVRLMRDMEEMGVDIHPSPSSETTRTGVSL